MSQESSTLLRLDDGTIIKVHHFEVVSEEELQAVRLEKIDQLAVLNDFLGISTKEDGVVDGDRTPEAPATEETIVPPAPEPAQPEAVAAPVAEPTPEAVPAPVEQPAAAEAPAPVVNDVTPPAPATAASDEPQPLVLQ